MSVILSRLLSEPPRRPVLRLVKPLPADTDFEDSVAAGYVETDIDAWADRVFGEA